jgi:cytochrome c oxidase subunit 2
MRFLFLADVDNSYAMEHRGSYWFPEQASTFAPDTDFLYMAIFWISAAFFAGIVGVMCWFAFKYRRRGKAIEPQPSSSHNTALEIFWSVVPSIILVWIFYVGATGYFNLRIATDDAEEIQVRASRWNWQFTYPNGDVSDQLHLVIDKPVKLVMRSEDVLHCFYVAAFRQKMDIVPGRYTFAYIVPTKAGKFRLACAEYCGDEHSKMRTLCQVHTSEADRRSSTEWIRNPSEPWKTGERLYKINCSGCHKVDGQAATGPALNLIWGKDENLADGSTVKVDENYVRESILYPNVKIVAGYGPVSKMNSFDGKFSDQQINDIIWFLKYIKDPGKYANFDPAKETQRDQGGSAEGSNEPVPAKAPADEKQAPDPTQPPATNQN